MSIEAIGKVTTVQPGKFILGCASATVLVLAFGLSATPVTADLLGGLDVDVGADVDLGGSHVNADVNLGADGLGAGLDVGLAVDGVSGTGPGGGLIDDDGLRRKAAEAMARGAMVCAKDGNVTTYNGFLVRDRDGKAFGWVHEATVSPNGKLLSVRLQSSRNSCYKLSNARFRIRGDEIWANVDAVTFR